MNYEQEPHVLLHVSAIPAIVHLSLVFVLAVNSQDLATRASSRVNLSLNGESAHTEQVPQVKGHVSFMPDIPHLIAVSFLATQAQNLEILFPSKFTLNRIVLSTQVVDVLCGLK